MKISEPIWRVTVTEHDRFSGVEVLSQDAYTTEQEARAAAHDVNKRNTAFDAPDCYLAATVEKIQ